jgi:CHAT domain-containing protein
MSACQSGLGKVFEAGVRAWYDVGAPQIVMSLWNIDDNATMELMLEFIRRLNQVHLPNMRFGMPCRSGKKATVVCC